MKRKPMKPVKFVNMLNEYRVAMLAIAQAQTATELEKAYERRQEASGAMLTYVFDLEQSARSARRRERKRDA